MVLRLAAQLLFLIFFFVSAAPVRCEAPPPLRVGWVGAMSGPVARYGAYQSALLAMEDINSAGGVGGRRLELIFEDGKGEGRTAVSALNKLLFADKVRLIVGGHCTPESFPMSSIVQQQNALMLAAITSSPKLSSAGDNVFRVSPVSTVLADTVGRYAFETLDVKRLAILFEETDYARPQAERLKFMAEETGVQVPYFDSYNPGETDFLSILTRIRALKPDALYLGVQAPESGVQILRNLAQLGMRLQVIGNEITGNAINSAKAEKGLVEGLVFAEPEFNTENGRTKEFIERYKKRFEVDGLPMGFWSAEAYDAVQLLAATIGRCGESVDEVKRCLYETKNYEGVSGAISIDRNGDGVRDYVLKIVRDGIVSPIKN